MKVWFLLFLLGHYMLSYCLDVASKNPQNTCSTNEKTFRAWFIFFSLKIFGTWYHKLQVLVIKFWPIFFKRERLQVIFSLVQWCYRMRFEILILLCWYYYIVYLSMYIYAEIYTKTCNMYVSVILSLKLCCCIARENCPWSYALPGYRCFVGSCPSHPDG